MSHAPRQGESQGHQREALDPAAFRAIAEFTYDWESWVDAQGRVVWVNAAVERITGYRADECLAMPDYPLPLIHQDDRAGLRELGLAALAGESGNHIEFRILAKDGSSRWAAISYQPIVHEQGTRTGYRSSVRDIEERKQMEARLREALAQAEEANRAKTRFLASVSHELRTPLQSLISHAELIARAHLPDKLRRYAENMTHEGEHLARLVGDLLDFSALEAGGLTIALRPFNPSREFSHRLDSLARAAARKGLRFTFQLGEPGILVESDPDRCLQVLTNLVSNAIQYTEEGEVAVVVHAQGSLLTIDVEDTGPGLPPGVEVFEPFRRGQGESAHPGGFGLGLAISARLCRRLGGSLTAQSGRRGGTRMIARVPVERVSTEDSPEQRVRKTLVLLIDDTASSREALADAVRALGHEARTAESLEEALSKLDAEAPQLVLLDLNMPGPDVTDKARLLRGRLGAGPRLLVMSAGGIGIDAATLVAAGVDSFIQKPISLETLTRLLGEHVDPQASAAAPEPPAREGWRSSRLRELRSFGGPGAPSLGERIALRLDADITELLGNLRDAVRKGSFSAVGNALHGLSGLAALVGATQAQEDLRKLEENALAQQTVEVADVERILEAMRAGFFEHFPLSVSAHST